MLFNVGFIDDEKDLCEMFSETYSEDGQIQVQTFSDPNEAISRLKSEPPHLLFVDYRMPGTDGVKVAHSLGLKIPIVLLTGEIEVNPDYPFYKIIYKPDLDDEIGKTIAAVRASH